MTATCLVSGVRVLLYFTLQGLSGEEVLFEGFLELFVVGDVSDSCRFHVFVVRSVIGEIVWVGGLVLVLDGLGGM